MSMPKWSFTGCLWDPSENPNPHNTGIQVCLPGSSLNFLPKVWTKTGMVFTKLTGR